MVYRALKEIEIRDYPPKSGVSQDRIGLISLKPGDTIEAELVDGKLKTSVLYNNGEPVFLHPLDFELADAESALGAVKKSVVAHAPLWGGLGGIIVGGLLSQYSDKVPVKVLSVIVGGVGGFIAVGMISDPNFLGKLKQDAQSIIAAVKKRKQVEEKMKKADS